jgi:hypothetical protein
MQTDAMVAGGIEAAQRVGKITHNKGCVALQPRHLHEKSCLLKAKEELWKLKYFTMQKYNLQKIL